jgi:hypothetical protein
MLHRFRLLLEQLRFRLLMKKVPLHLYHQFLDEVGLGNKNLVQGFLALQFRHHQL